MPVLYISKGTYQVTADDILDSLAGGSASGNLKWKSGTSFYGELDHANTGDRVYTFPNASGIVALLSNPQTWTGLQTFNTGTLKISNILGITTTNEIDDTITGWDFKVATGISHTFDFIFGAVINYSFREDHMFFGANYLELVETVDPGAPAVNRARIWIEDNGAGKTRLLIRFNTGAPIQIAIQP